MRPTSIIAALLLCVRSVDAFSAAAAVGSRRQPRCQPLMAQRSSGDDDVPLLTLLEERRLGALLKRAAAEPPAVLALLQDAGFAGVLAYAMVFVAFYSVAVPVGEVAYHTASGGWVDPRVLLEEDGAPGKAEFLALSASFYLLCKVRLTLTPLSPTLTPLSVALTLHLPSLPCQPFAPLRLGGALLLTPDVKRVLSTLQGDTEAASATQGATGGPAARRKPNKRNRDRDRGRGPRRG